MAERRPPGAVRDSILRSFEGKKEPQTVAEIHTAVVADIGAPVSPSSVRSYLNLNTPGLFVRTDRGTYRMVRR